MAVLKKQNISYLLLVPALVWWIRLAVTSLSQSSALPPCFLLLSHSVSFPPLSSALPLFSSAKQAAYWVVPSFPFEGQQFCLPAPPSGKVPQIESKRPFLNTGICSPLLYTLMHVNGCVSRTTGPVGHQCRKRGVRILSSTILCTITLILGILYQNHVLFIYFRTTEYWIASYFFLLFAYLGGVCLSFSVVKKKSYHMISLIWDCLTVI